MAIQAPLCRVEPKSDAFQFAAYTALKDGDVESLEIGAITAWDVVARIGFGDSANVGLAHSKLRLGLLGLQVL